MLNNFNIYRSLSGKQNQIVLIYAIRGRHGRDLIVVGFTTTCAISACHHSICEFEPRSWRGVFDTTLCDKICQRLATGQWLSPSTLVSSTNKTDGHDITEILLKVALKVLDPNLIIVIVKVINIFSESRLLVLYCRHLSVQYMEIHASSSLYWNIDLIFFIFILHFNYISIFFK
jgi:hypothetical protein